MNILDTLFLRVNEGAALAEKIGLRDVECHLVEFAINSIFGCPSVCSTVCEIQREHRIKT